MRTIDIQEATAHLLQLVEAAAAGEPFVIAKAGKPLVKVVPVDPPHTQMRRLGFMDKQCSVPEDFDQMGAVEIEKLFYGSTDTVPQAAVARQKPR